MAQLPRTSYVRSCFHSVKYLNIEDADRCVLAILEDFSEATSNVRNVKGLLWSALLCSSTLVCRHVSLNKA
jgi:hypothetical protein